jgi:hypothetical protein
MEQLELSNNEVTSFTNYIINYFKLSWEEQRSSILEWQRYAESMVAKEGINKHQTFLLPGSSAHQICKNALAKLLGKGCHAWSTIGKGGKERHGLSIRAETDGGNRKMPQELRDQLHDYFYILQGQGAPRATQGNSHYRAQR